MIPSRWATDQLESESIVKLDLLAIGEPMAEIRQASDLGFRIGFGGDTFNTAVYCARRMGASAQIGYFTRIGRDPLSKAFLGLARAESIDVASISIDSELKIGIYTTATDETGERQLNYWRSNSAARRMFSSADSLECLPAAQVVYLSGITLAILPPSARQDLIEYLRDLRQRNACDVAFDSNYRPQLWENAGTARCVINEMWKIADIALPSVEDEISINFDADEDAVISRFAAKDWHACAIKRGMRGPVSPRLKFEEHPEFAPAPKVVDTTAAGDSFNGSYLASLIQGENERQCLLSGHETASMVVGEYGAIINRI